MFLLASYRPECLHWYARDVTLKISKIAHVPPTRKRKRVYHARGNVEVLMMSHLDNGFQHDNNRFSRRSGGG